MNKKGAIELSIGTVVIIVIAMSMLILGLVLVRNIFTGATESVDSLNDKVRAEITNLFTEEGSKIGIKLGADKIAKIEAGTNGFGIGFGGKTKDGGNILDGTTTTNLWYSLELANAGSPTACVTFEEFILEQNFSGEKLATPKRFEEEIGPNGYTRLVFNIPEGTAECSESIKIITYDAGKSQVIATSSFRVQITSGKIFS